MNLKHTKGEWWLTPDKSIGEKHADYLVIQGHNGSSKNIARVFKGIDISKEMHDANAKLIAAAPQLLNALIELRKVMEMGESYAPALQKAKEAIKKATE